nr:MAG TPA: hypothetical protein [Crassvirales sp.]
MSLNCLTLYNLKLCILWKFLLKLEPLLFILKETKK